jgi:aminoglycoside phosphotransferase (APT) family kinase protein
LTDVVPLDASRLAPALQRVIAAKFGPDARVQTLAVMEKGHAGLTFGFDVCGAQGQCLSSLVLKLAPPGVRRLGNTDVYRQAPLLRALHAVGLPVPDVPFASAEETELGTPFIMMQRLAGQPFFIWEPDPSIDLAPAAVAPLWRQCVQVLADLHRFDWRRHLADWEAPRPLREEVVRWDGVLAKAPEPAWIAAGEQVRELLLARMPDADPVGLVHGDYQPGNALYEAGLLTGIIDWELASIGSQLLDLGWLMMLADRASWHADWAPVAPLGPREIRDLYEEAAGRRFARTPWYQALAGYRLGAISCLNVRLHRTGRRPDATWEKFALAVPSMFARADALLRGEEA